MQNRLLRTKIPAHVSKFLPKICTDVETQMKNKTERTRFYYDKTAKARNGFEIDEHVMVYLDNKWSKGIIIKKWHTPRSYVVHVDGHEYRRNSRHIRHIGEMAEPNENVVVDVRRTRSGKVYNKY